MRGELQCKEGENMDDSCTGLSGHERISKLFSNLNRDTTNSECPLC